MLPSALGSLGQLIGVRALPVQGYNVAFKGGRYFIQGLWDPVRQRCASSSSQAVFGSYRDNLVRHQVLQQVRAARLGHLGLHGQALIASAWPARARPDDGSSWRAARQMRRRDSKSRVSRPEGAGRPAKRAGAGHNFGCSK